jgi:hypothetical protein
VNGDEKAINKILSERWDRHIREWEGLVQEFHRLCDEMKITALASETLDKMKSDLESLKALRDRARTRAAK